MNINKIAHVFLVGLMMSGLMLFSPSHGFAQSTSNEDQVTFAMLGFQDEILHGPYSSLDARFNVPPTWVLKSGANLVLNINVSFASTATLSNELGTDVGAALQIAFNDVVLDNIFLTSGPQILDIPIPPEALTSQRLDGRNELRIFLNASIDCEFDHQTTVLIQASSSINLPHEQKIPELDLRRFPSPIYQHSSFIQEPALILIGDSPTASELRAALTVAAGFGRITGNQQSLELIPVSQLSEDNKVNSHIIAVGKPESLSILNEVNFPVSINNSVIDSPDLAADDGIIQMAHSPWNETDAVLYVGGNSDIGVVKAAQALTFGEFRTGSRVDVAMVSDISTVFQTTPVLDDRTFASLGYEIRTISGIGRGTLEYQFYVPPGLSAGANPFLELVYTHSALMDLTRSGAIITLNDQSIGSFRFTEETASRVNDIQFGLPDYAIRPGNNRLEIQAELATYDQCAVLASDRLWMTVSPTSFIHLPLVPVEAGTFPTPQTLDAYPYPFIANPNLAETVVVLPVRNPVAWNIAGKILANLGNYATGALITPEVVFADGVNDEIRSRYDLLIIGMAKELPIITELNDQLPAPFMDGGNIAREESLAVSYKIPEGVDVGYLQFLPAPWDSKRLILAVMGSSLKGMEWAGAIFIDPQLRSQLSGNFAVASERQIFTSDTRLGFGTDNLSATAVPGDYPATPRILQSNPNIVSRPGWIIPMIIVVTLLILVVLIIVIGNRIAQNRSLAKKDLRENNE